MKKPECKCKNSKTATDVTGMPYCVYCGGIGLKQEAEDLWPKKLTREEIYALRTPNGGWTKNILELLGVAWPPPAGWIDDYLKESDNETQNKHQRQ